jgi:hypothetical protein
MNSDKGHEGLGLFAKLSGALKPRIRKRRSAQPAIPSRTEPATLIVASSIPTSSTTALPATQTPEVAADVSEGVNMMNSAVAPDSLPCSANQQTALPLDPSGDREKTEGRYKEAVEQLKKSVKLPRKNWETFEIPDFKNLVDVTDLIPQLQEDIKKTLDARKDAFKDQNFWSKSKRITEGIFIAISPFAKNFLFVAKQGSNVFPVEDFFTDLVAVPAKSIRPAMWWTTPFDYSILTFNLFLTGQIADRELARRKAVEKNLDYISRQLGLLEIIKRLPDTGVQPDQLVNRTVDVFSAALMYLAIHIRHESNRLGVMGKPRAHEEIVLIE